MRALNSNLRSHLLTFNRSIETLSNPRCQLERVYCTRKNKIAGILADEMGLGKTLQTISFLGYLRYIEKIPGPRFLVIAPKSTLNNWLREINRWTPDVNAFILQGDKERKS